MRYTIIVEAFNCEYEADRMFVRKVNGTITQASRAACALIKKLSAPEMPWIVECARIENPDEVIVWSQERAS
jgi:hypothetical protein